MRYYAEIRRPKRDDGLDAGDHSSCDARPKSFDSRRSHSNVHCYGAGTLLLSICSPAHLCALFLFFAVRYEDHARSF